MAGLRKYIRSVFLVLLLYTAAAAWWLILRPEAPHRLTVSASLALLILPFYAWIVLVLIRSYPTRVGAQLFGLLTSLTVAALALTTYLILLYWTSGDAGLYLVEKQQSTVRFFFVFSCYGWIASIATFHQRFLEIDKQLRDTADAAALLKEAELFKLRQQIQPHFLYNSLNSINALIRIEPHAAQEMVGRLSDFLRNSVKRESGDLVALQEEIAYIENYLAIESVRFGDRLKVAVSGQEQPALIPPFILQPLLENAIKFGLNSSDSEVCIRLDFLVQEHMLQIEVRNPFDERSPPPSGTGFGLKSIQRRLQLLFARPDLLETSASGNIYFTKVKIPQV